MIEVIKQTEPKARKEYRCGLSEDVGNIDFPKGMTFTERRILLNYEKKHRRILKGEIYVKQINKYEGEVYTFRMDKEMFKIFCKYDLFPEM